MAGDHQPKHAAVNGSDWRRKLAKSLHRRRPSQPRSDEVRAAAYELFHRVDELHHNYGWPYFDFEERAYKATRQAREAFEQNKSMTKDDMLKALAPVLDEWWPERLGLTDAARHAVDRLRRAVAEAKYAPDTDIHHRLTDIGQPHQRVA